MKNQKSRRGLVVTLVLSLVANVVLLAVSVYVIGTKTKFFQRKEVRLGLKEQKEQDPQSRGDYWCIQGWTNTLKKLGYDADVVFFGNSITSGGNFQNYFPDKKTCNLGYPGDGMVGMALRVGQVKAVNPEKVFVMTGINGSRGRDNEVFESQYQRMVDTLRKVVPNAEVYLQSILPVNYGKTKAYANIEEIKSANEIIKKIAQRSNCIYVDLWTLYQNEGEMPQELTRDGVHLFPEAYDRWMEEIRKYIEE